MQACKQQLGRRCLNRVTQELVRPGEYIGNHEIQLKIIEKRLKIDEILAVRHESRRFPPGRRPQTPPLQPLSGCWPPDSPHHVPGKMNRIDFTWRHLFLLLFLDHLARSELLDPRGAWFTTSSSCGSFCSSARTMVKPHSSLTQPPGGPRRGGKGMNPCPTEPN